MQIEDSYTFDVDQATVWEALQNPKLLGMIIPTCWGVESVGEHKYIGTLKFQVGQMSGIFKGEIQLSNLNPPTSYDVIVSGKSPIGIVRVEGGMWLEEIDDEQTTMHYKGTAAFGGRIASVGSRLVDAAVKSMIDLSFKTLNQHFIQNKGLET